MDILIKLAQFLLSLSLLIVLHELGHFIPAKLFKTRVEKFYLFFDVKFSLIKKKIGETEYGIGWLPLGGYVKIAGMIDESMDKEQMALPPQPWEFRSKPAWQRLIIMLGGVTVNFVLAFIIYIGLAFAYGDLYIDNKDLNDGVWITNPVVEKIGLHTGDKIVSVDGVEVNQFHQLNEKIIMGREIVLDRQGDRKTIEMPINFIAQYMDGKKMSVVELRVPFIINGLQEDSPNSKVLMLGDQVESINGVATPYADVVMTEIDKLKGKTVPAVVNRDGKATNINLNINPEGKLGAIYSPRLPLESLEKMGLYKVNRAQFGILESIPFGIEKGREQLFGYGKQLKMIANPETGAYKGVGGFKAIYDIFPAVWNWQIFWTITALLSIMLGVMNLLPIPALDGGHVMFLLYEIITRRKPSDKFMEYAQLAGFLLLITLVLLANGNDVYKAIIGN
ncbi:MAG: RIP metalloprotease RseP [Flavobacterium sp.]